MGERGNCHVDDLTAIENVFNEISNEPWFDPVFRYAFSQYLVEYFASREYDANLHRYSIEEVARTRYKLQSPNTGRLQAKNQL